MNSENVAMSLKRFLLVEQCPTSWNGMDLYLFRDENVVFYVGQSHLAFARVWEHLLNGFKGHSMVGRFVWCNWPKSMRFTIELLSSESEQFSVVRNELNASERLLIQHWSPCFNLSQNHQPTPLPDSYLPPNAPFRRRRSLNMLIHEAERAVKADDTKHWLENMQ
ncbi:MAG TPA: GIY-YIG nuclease family protein [Anaerolineales bacterium]|nr:GIY-YIG nuclease family protein [Anaerolineales bacterium]